MADHEGLRPTPDRVRETLFNWLAPVIRGSRVLDCCAGSGVLGLEAASRGAGRVTLVEKDRRVAQAIRSVSARLGDGALEIVNADIVDYLAQGRDAFDIAFIDPPYALVSLRQRLLALLVEGRLRDGALLYLEWPAHEPSPEVPPGLEWQRRKSAGQIVYAIAQWRDTR